MFLSKLRPRSISTASLQTSLLFHLRPIYLIVYKGSYSFLMRSLILGWASRLDAFSVYPFRMWLSSHATGVTTGTPLIRPLRSSRTRSSPLKLLTPAMDMNQTVSRRFEPSSRTTLMGEQPNPWDLLQPQDVMSRHRGAKPPRRYELLGEISLLSPG